MGTRLMVTAGTLVLAAALGCGADDAGGPSPAFDELFLEVSTPEYQPPRYLLVVGETGSAHVLAFRDGVGVTPEGVTFTSSQPGVLGVSSFGPVDATLVALAPGAVELRASADGRADTAVVEVVAAPLPVDHLGVRLAPISTDLEATYDGEGNLGGVRLPVGSSAALDARVERGGQAVSLIPFELTSSNPGVARPDPHCRSPEVDPDCSIFSEWGWVTGVAPGTATVTLTVRNLTATFVVEVF